MRIALVGPELEENLGLRYLHSSAVTAGHEARIIEFDGPGQIEAVCAEIVNWRPDVAGLSMVYTARAREFTDLAVLLRLRGFAGRIVAGGHFASFHSEDILTGYPSFDYIVHGEGEQTLVDLLNTISEPQKVPGISYRDAAGFVCTTGVRPNPEDLDILPPPTRTPPFYTYMGIPIANILGSRGCFGNCTFCSITAWYRQNTGPRFRQRSVGSIVFEMARLYNEHKVRIFNFHDDTFFQSSEQDNLERFEAMERALRVKGMTDIAIQVKARTDAVTPAVLDVLGRIGLFRVFLGVENHSPEGLKSLGKGTTVDQNRAALDLLRARKMHVTFNLLMFGPETTVEQVRDNVECIREFGDVPLNFGRAEIYSGTPLERGLRKSGRLKGDWFGYHYDIADRRAQEIFNVVREVFTERNFQTGGMNFKAMKLDYYYQILRHFFPRRDDERLFTRKKMLLEDLNRSNADLLSAICDSVDDDDRNNRTLARDLLHVRRSDDERLSKAFLSCIRDIEARAAGTGGRVGRAQRDVAAASAAAAILLSVQHCGPNKPVDPAVLTPDSHTLHTDTLAHLDSAQVAMVERRIDTLYKKSVDSLGLYTGYFNKPMQCNLVIDSGGIVDSCMVLSPSRDSARSFVAGFESLVKTWTFPDIRRSGTCGITMTVAAMDTVDWHICEVIGYPMDTTFTPFDSGDAALVRDRVYSAYYSAVDSLCSRYGCTDKPFTMTLRIFSTGAVYKSSVEPSGQDTLPPGFVQALTDTMTAWTFPGVSRGGSCSVSSLLHVVWTDPGICEIMAFPPAPVEYPPVPVVDPPSDTLRN
jgi:anaerobic magnesium-protoporphyrin IX monomethyl ester cyclase